MLIVRIITLLGLLFFLGSCELFNKPEEIPAYVKIETPVLITDPQTQGANSNAITDGWIYINDEPIGVLEFPAEFPVLTWAYQHKSICWNQRKRFRSAKRNLSFLCCLRN